MVENLRIKSFTRDWSWVPRALEEAYNIGKLDGLTEKDK